MYVLATCMGVAQLGSAGGGRTSVLEVPSGTPKPGSPRKTSLKNTNPLPRTRGLQGLKKTPGPPVTKTKQHPAVHHIRKFLADEFVVDPRGVTSISAFGRAYYQWCEVFDVRNRRLTPVALLDHLENHHGIVAKQCYLTNGGMVYGIS